MIISSPIGNLFGQTKTIEAQAQSYKEIILQAEADAREYESGIVYGIGGFCFGLLGWIFAMESRPDVPASRLIGKSPNEAAIYAEAYKRKVKSIRKTAACIGWAMNVPVAVIFVLIVN